MFWYCTVYLRWVFRKEFCRVSISAGVHHESKIAVQCSAVQCSPVQSRVSTTSVPVLYLWQIKFTVVLLQPSAEQKDNIAVVPGQAFELGKFTWRLGQTRTLRCADMPSLARVSPRAFPMRVFNGWAWWTDDYWNTEPKGQWLFIYLLFVYFIITYYIVLIIVQVGSGLGKPRRTRKNNVKTGFVCNCECWFESDNLFI